MIQRGPVVQLKPWNVGSCYSNCEGIKGSTQHLGDKIEFDLSSEGPLLISDKRPSLKTSNSILSPR